MSFDSFKAAFDLQPLPVRVWGLWMVFANIAAVLILLLSRETRRDAVAILLLDAPNVAAVLWIHEQLGYVRLMGLAHVIFWTPLAIFLWRRLEGRTPPTPFRQVIWILLITISVSLLIDYLDVARYLLGEQQPLA